jgi:hypothetical protein
MLNFCLVVVAVLHVISIFITHDMYQECKDKHLGFFKTSGTVLLFLLFPVIYIPGGIVFILGVFIHAQFLKACSAISHNRRKKKLMKRVTLTRI